MVPVNLINEIKDVGFDYGMSPFDVAVGVRFGIGDVVDASGQRRTRDYLLTLLEEDDHEALRDVYGVVGGHIIVAEKQFVLGLKPSEDGGLAMRAR